MAIIINCGTCKFIMLRIPEWENNRYTRSIKKNPAYGIQWISQCVRKRVLITKNPKKERTNLNKNYVLHLLFNVSDFTWNVEERQGDIHRRFFSSPENKLFNHSYVCNTKLWEQGMWLQLMQNLTSGGLVSWLSIEELDQET